MLTLKGPIYDLWFVSASFVVIFMCNLLLKLLMLAAFTVVIDSCLVFKLVTQRLGIDDIISQECLYGLCDCFFSFLFAH